MGEKVKEMGHNKENMQKGGKECMKGVASDLWGANTLIALPTT